MTAAPPRGNFGRALSRPPLTHEEWVNGLRRTAYFHFDQKKRGSSSAWAVKSSCLEMA